MIELCTRLAVVLTTPSLTLVCIFWDAGLAPKAGLWLAWLTTTLVIDAMAPRIAPTSPRPQPIAWLDTVLACLPCPLHAATLLVAMWAHVVEPSDRGIADAIAAAAMIGVSAGTVGISAAHELAHRPSALLRGIAQAHMFLVTYPHFPLVHLQVHHRYVGTPVDPGTSRLDEPLHAFVPRAISLAWQGGWRSERKRLGRLGLPAWHWRNRMARVVVLQVLLLAAIGWVFGMFGLTLFMMQSMVALLLTLTIDYTQHYGVVRRQVSAGRLEPVRAEHSWTSDHASNRATFNLGLHADHHLAPGGRYPELTNAGGSLQAPFGYPGLFLLALVPTLWFRVMNSRFAAARTVESKATAPG